MKGYLSEAEVESLENNLVDKSITEIKGYIWNEGYPESYVYISISTFEEKTIYLSSGSLSEDISLVDSKSAKKDIKEKDYKSVVIIEEKLIVKKIETVDYNGYCHNSIICCTDKFDFEIFGGVDELIITFDEEKIGKVYH